MNTIHINDVKVIDRVRACRDVDVISLAKSIEAEGLIHPITISEDNTLIAGGHRLSAFKLLAEKDKKYEQIPYVRFEEYARSMGLLKEDEVVDKASLKLLEIEENMKRKSMTWQEMAIGISTYHELAKRSPKAINWTQTSTAQLFGVAQAYVSPILRIAKRLENKNDKIWECEGITEAIQLLLKEKKEQAQAKLGKAMKVKTAKVSKAVKVGDALAGLNFVDLSDEETEDESKADSGTYSKEWIKNIYTMGDCLETLISMGGKFDHIITDPPYGIEMDNFMNSESVENVAEQHKVDENLELLPKFLKVARQCAKDTSFLCMWYDLAHHEKIIKWAEEANWLPCRWNFVWCKTSPCVNRTAQYNITKATEVCMFMRASPKAVLAQKRSNNWILADNFATSKDHPFGKPEVVWNWLIDTVSFEGQTILDPFAGCGSSLYSIIKKNRIPLGIEVKQDHIINGINWLNKKLNS